MPTTTIGEYLFDSASDLGSAHLDALTALLDRYTDGVLDGLPLPAHPRCLEIGAGNGSIARAIADRTAGDVLAIDLDTTSVTPGPGVEVRRHDIRDGVPGGDYDLIHARCLLVHLPEREEILTGLVAALAPGGWLVLGDIGSPPTAVTVPEAGDREVWDRYAHIAYDIVGPRAGHSYSWAGETHDRMLDEGLQDVHAEAFRPFSRGDDVGARCHVNLSMQAEGPLLSAGLAPGDMRRYREMLLDPRLRAWFFEIVYTWGRRAPAEV
ncbi:MAG: class I SAM-dependent methyltransferase [Microbacterium sp.]|jgi:SAM-dependent methyltransferase|nr:class I SAM-dependent methyltransferase [Microbacterium sp.]